MRIKCQSCGKYYDTDKDELCPNCGSYNQIQKETADPNGSYADDEQLSQEREEYNNREKLPDKNYVRDLQHGKGWLVFILSRLAIFCVVLLLVQQVCELLRVPIHKYLMGQIGSITVSEYKMNESFALNNGVLLSVEGSQSLDLKPEWYQQLSEYQSVLNDMKLTAVLFQIETPGEVFTYDNGQDVYLKASGHVYDPIYAWTVEEEVCEQYGAQPVSGYGEEEAGLKGIVFLVPEEDLEGEQIFCIQQNSTVSIFDIEKTDSRIQVKLEQGV